MKQRDRDIDSQIETRWSLGAVDAGDARVALSRIDVDRVTSIEIVVTRAGREQRIRLRLTTAIAVVALLGGAIDKLKGAA